MYFTWTCGIKGNRWWPLTFLRDKQSLSHLKQNPAILLCVSKENPFLLKSPKIIPVFSNRVEGWRVDARSQDINQTQAQFNDAPSHAQLFKSFQELELFDLDLLVQLLSAVLESL